MNDAPERLTKPESIDAQIRKLEPGLVAFANRQVKRFHQGRDVDPVDLVQSAYRQLARQLELKGGLPDGVPLKKFLIKYIFQAATNRARAYVRAQRWAAGQVELDAPGTPDLEDHRARSPEEIAALSEVTSLVINHVLERAEADGEEDVAFLLWAFKEGHTKRGDVFTHCGWGQTEWRKAKAKLDEYLAVLPEELNARVQEALADEGGAA